MAEEEFQSADYKGLLPILEAFLAKAGRNATSACFDVAGPVIGGRAHLTNLPWDLEETALFGRRNHEQETGFHERLKTTESEGTE